MTQASRDVPSPEDVDGTPLTDDVDDTPPIEVVYRPRAQRDLDSIVIYIGVVQDNPRAAARLVDTLLEKIDLLVRFPNLGKLFDTDGTVNHDYRLLVVDDYRVFYRVDHSRIVIYRIVHARRDLEDYDLVNL